MFYFFIFFVFALNVHKTYNHNMLRDMTVMMGAQLGASIANQSISTMYSQIAQGITTDQTNMNIASKQFLQNVGQAQQNQLKTIVSLFSSAEKQVSDSMTQQTNIMQFMQNYINSIVSLQMPVPDYLAYPVYYDELFANATMYTPQGVIWKNIFQVGNWQYDETSDSFWQMQEVPFENTQSNTTTTQTAYQNFIFTEWSSMHPYEITCDITLYKISYPFYAGIVFNKARWISGDTDGIQKYRTFGLYGNEKQQISVCFSQQILDSKKSDSSNSQIIHPLTQITQNIGVLPIKLNSKKFNSLQQQPITFHLKIKPNLDYINYKFWIDGSNEPVSYSSYRISSTTTKTSKQILKNTITVTQPDGTSFTYLAPNNNDIYLYHGIGFLSPGAIAKFKLLSPQEIVFNPISIQAFTNEFNAYVQQQKAANSTSKLEDGLLGG